MSQISKECEKAASTLTSFIENRKMPIEVLAGAKGLAIFSAFRAGMYFAGSSGSGVVVARLPNGTWSPPSGFSVKSGGVGFVYGVDVFDCVCVLNTQAAVDAYTSPEFKVGGRVDFAAGPVGGKFDAGETPPVWTYTKSRGVYGGVTFDGTSIKEQMKANTEFFGEPVAAANILQGKVQDQKGSTQWPAGAEALTIALESVAKRG
ncbi:hypothetical protein LTR10_001750 [Elasticomyces elasticus]|nr:hypothetical protein LTR10_001750 [Elasticomyces elasticus]KAK4975249.1 hypothetical protein LTR42_004459 [Elasticomyces elasticus]